MSMETNEINCRHEYVKIYQRKYKDFGRRLVSTRGYLPTGFSNKDFSFLTAGAYCFCTKCRKCLYPTRHQKVPQGQPVATQVIDITPIESADNIWTEDAAEVTAVTSQEIEVEELQIEGTDVSDIVEKEIAINQQDETEEENGEE